MSNSNEQAEILEVKKVELPTLKPEDNWLDQLHVDGGVPEGIKRLVYLPQLALRAAEYAHESDLNFHQKELLLHLFRVEANAVLGEVHTQVQITVGNSPADRIGYLKDFQSWEQRLIRLLKEALDCCMSTETWAKKLEVLLRENEPLLHSNIDEWEKRFGAHIRLGLRTFNADIYWRKFVYFTEEALKLLQIGSAMMEITREQPQWMYQAMKNVGKLPYKSGNAGHKKMPVLGREKSLKEIIMETAERYVHKPIKELTAVLQKVSSEKSAEAEKENKDAKREREGMIQPKPPEIFQKILWIQKYGIKHWKLVSLAIFIVLCIWILSKINLFS